MVLSSGTNNSTSSNSDLQDRGAEMDFYQTSPAVKSANEILVSSTEYDLQDRGALKDFYQTSPAVKSANEILVSSMEYDSQDSGAINNFYQTCPAVNSANEILVSSTEYELQDRGNGLDFYQTSLPPVNSTNEFLACSTKNNCDLENQDQSWVQQTRPVPAPMGGPNSNSDLKDRGAGMDFYQTSPPISSANKIWSEVCSTESHCDLENQPWVQPTCPVPAPLQGPSSNIQDRGVGMDFYHTRPPSDSANENLVCSTENHCDLENQGQPWRSNLKDRDAGIDFYQTSPPVNDSADASLVCSTEENHSDLENQGYPWGQPGCPVPAPSSDLQDRGAGMDFYYTSPPVNSANEFLVCSTKNHFDLENGDQSWIQPTCPVPVPMQGPNSSIDLKDREAIKDFYQTKPPVNSANEILVCSTENQGEPWDQPGCPVPVSLQGPKEASTITTTTEDKEEMFNSLQSLVDLANSDRESSSERVNLR